AGLGELELPNAATQMPITTSATTPTPMPRNRAVLLFPAEPLLGGGGASGGGGGAVGCCGACEAGTHCVPSHHHCPSGENCGPAPGGSCAIGFPSSLRSIRLGPERKSSGLTIACAFPDYPGRSSRTVDSAGP